MKSVLAVGDTHYPFTDQRQIKKIVAFAALHKPQRIVQLGDLYDFYSFSRWVRSRDLMTPKQEVDLGRKQAEAFWAELRRVCPQAQCYQLIGNHDARLAKRVMEAIPELERFLDHTKELWRFEGVETQPSEREELILDGVCFMHGYRKHGDHVKFNMMSTVVGHSHKGGTVYMRQRGKTIWELNAGFVALQSSLPMSYGPQKKLHQCTGGFGWIDEYGPRFIPEW